MSEERCFVFFKEKQIQNDTKKATKNVPPTKILKQKTNQKKLNGTDDKMSNQKKA